MQIKNILITGATSGIGEATAKLLSEQGHRLAMVGRNMSKLKELEKLGLTYACDMRDTDAFKALVEDVVQKWGSLDVLINNAGMGYFNPLIEAPLSEWHDMVDINIKGAMTAIHTCLPHLIASCGHIVNIASVGAHQVFPNSGVYCATKHALLAVSESLRLELSNQLSVTTISPGPVATAFIDQTQNPQLLNQYKDYFASGLDAHTVAQQISHALASSEIGVISEIIIRPKRVER